MNSIELRSETPADYNAIGNVLAAAFKGDDEPGLVQLLRETYAEFDPSLSIVATVDGQIVGHVPMTPCDMRLMRATIRAVCVAPVAVAPGSKGRGIGGAMMEYGHRLAMDAGFEVSFLHGHPGYYPRFGYRPAMGFATISVDLDKLEPPSGNLEDGPVDEADIEWLAARCSRELTDVDFGWLWTANLRTWRLPGLEARIWRDTHDEPAGYTVAKEGADNLALLLARDPGSAREIVRVVRPVSIAHHPSGWLARQALDVAWAQATVRPSNAAMAVELRKRVLAGYFDAVASGERPVGAVNHPLPLVLNG